MIQILVFAGLIIVSYGLGCFSTARFIAKSFKSLNIYKVGTGHPDTENIYSNIDKFLGIIAGITDFGKIYVYLFFLKILLDLFYPCLATQNHLLILGFVMVIGHCLPATHHFKGGRGIFTYIGFVTFFAPIPMLIIALLAFILIVGFKQIRFAQYMVVLLPPFINFLFPGGKEFLGKMFLAALLMAIINVFVSKRLGEI
jgi:acyl phosphate:glycerol-3-phosphate acyltransferase